MYLCSDLTLYFQVAAIATIVPAILALGNSKNDETVGKATAVIVMCVAAAGIILEVALIILRFLNVGILNMNSRLFLLVVCSSTLHYVHKHTHEIHIILGLCIVLDTATCTCMAL